MAARAVRASVSQVVELLAIALCAESAESELSSVDTTNKLVIGKLYNAARATAAA